MGAAAAAESRRSGQRQQKTRGWPRWGSSPLPLISVHLFCLFLLVFVAVHRWSAQRSSHHFTSAAVLSLLCLSLHLTDPSCFLCLCVVVA